MPRQATLQDVAVAAGVHRTTVSLALRDHPRIPAATRERIKAIAGRLGYRINPLVAALMQTRRLGRSERHVTLAFVTNYPTRFGWRPKHHDRPDYFPGATRRAHELGYKLEDFWLREPGMTPARFCRILAARGINGLLIARLPPDQHALDLEWNRFSCVALGMTLRSPVLHHVTENHFDTVAQAMQRFPLDLPHPLTAEVDLLTEIFPAHRLIPIQTKTARHEETFLLAEFGKGLHQQLQVALQIKRLQ